jgi:hypothetical protein
MYAGTNAGFVVRFQTENAAPASYYDIQSRETSSKPQLSVTFG